MRYWVYINDKVEGPYEEDKLVTLAGFSPETLICSEEIEAGGSQEWVKASSVFEFDPLQATFNQPLPMHDDLATAPMPHVSAQPETAQLYQAAAAQYAAPSADVSNILIEKLDHLTQEIESLKSKLDQAITAAAVNKSAAYPKKPHNFTDSDTHAHTITLTQADLSEHVQEDALVTSTASLVSQAESLIAEAQSNTEEKPLDFLQSVDLGEDRPDTLVPAEEPLPKGGEELVLRSALDSLYNSKIQSDAEKEATFQDLLTPKQAADLQKTVREAALNYPTLDEALIASETPSTLETEKSDSEQAPVTETERDAFLKELTDHPREDILSQLIEEKQTEKELTEEEKTTAAQDLALAAATAGVGLSLQEAPAFVHEAVVAQQPAVQEVSAVELPSAEDTPTAQQPAVQEVSAVELPSAEDTPSAQQPAVQEVSAVELPSAEDTPSAQQPAVQEVPAVELPSAEDTPSAQQPAVEPEPAFELPNAEVTPMAESAQPEAVEKQDLNLEGQPELKVGEVEPETPVVSEAIEPEEVQAQPSGNSDLPSLERPESNDLPTENAESSEETLQELVPGVTIEAPERNAPLTEADLRDAFEERPAVEEMTIAQNMDSQLSQEEMARPAPVLQEMPTMTEQTASSSLPMGDGSNNPNDLTEIELKEGSTYLISDFVPPAQTNNNEVPKELNGLKDIRRDDLQSGKVQGIALNGQGNDHNKPQTFSDDIVEVVPAKKEMWEGEVNVSEASVSTDATPDVTISKVILENTIKTKRGASLDIKTVPMVPEPASTARLDLGDTELEDINAQHDLKSADVKPAGGMTKIVVGALVSIVILAVIYVMLAFLNIIPAQYNVISSGTVKSDQEQSAQLDEMLGEPAITVPGDPSAQPRMPQPGPMDAVTAEVKNVPLANGMTLKNLIEARHPAMKDLIEWDVTTAVDPDNYSILVKVPPENPQSFKISYRFNYNVVTKALDPTISDSKNLLDSLRGPGMTQTMPMQPAMQQTAPRAPQQQPMQRMPAPAR